MREHGVDMPDPQVGSNGEMSFSIGAGPGKLDRSKLQEAQEACQDLMPTGLGKPGDIPQEQRDAMLAFAQCMRDHGIDMPDPQFETGGRVMIGGPGEDGDGPKFDPQSEDFQAAEDACGDLLGEMRPGSGTNVAPGGGDSGAGPRGPAMTRRRLVRAGIGLAAVGALAVGVASTGILGAMPASGGQASEDPAATAADRATVPVERRTLTIEETLDGTLGYTGETQVLNGLAGTLTRLPELGAILERGDQLYEVNGKRRPVLLYGARPAWRAFKPDMSNGADVKQLEENLKALGYTHKGFDVDREWDDATTAAVKRWQRANGMTVDGTIAPGEVVFAPGAVRVTELPIDVGLQVGPGQAVLNGTSRTCAW